MFLMPIYSLLLLLLLLFVMLGYNIPTRWTIGSSKSAEMQTCGKFA